MSSPDKRRALVRSFIESYALDDELRDPLMRLVDRASVALMLETMDSNPLTLAVSALEPLPEPETDDPASLSEIETAVIEPEVAATDTVEADVVHLVQTRTAPRYMDMGRIGVGGMAEVRRVRDEHLQREMAMKVVSRAFQSRALERRRFLDEAQLTAQLTHPGIVPVHELGTLQDGRLYFTMKEVVGETFADVLEQYHQPEGGGTTWTLRRLMDVFHRVCEAVAYAHHRGVIHRDLKPANIMVGEFGAVLVMDWGLARLVDRGPDSEAPNQEGPNQRGPKLNQIEPRMSSRTDPAGPLMSRAGTVAGTPAYMSPEQARGQSAQLGPPSDVYSLGSILYEILCGMLPRTGSVVEILGELREGRPVDWTSLSGRRIPDELRGICECSMATEAEDRFRDAGELAKEVSAWLEGARKRERALSIVAKARELLPRVSPLREQAATLRREAHVELAKLSVQAGIEEKVASWRLLDRAEDLEQEAELKLVEVTELLHGALAHDPDLGEAHRLLADVHADRHAEAEERREWSSAARHAVLLRAHDTGSYADYLSGRGTLSLITEPSCEAVLSHLDSSARVIAVTERRPLGATPLQMVDLPVGTYLLELVRGGQRTRYPVEIRRRSGWTSVPPGTTVARTLALPEPGSTEADDVFVPEGWCRAGGDADAAGGLPGGWDWVDSFVVKRFVVTQREYFAFLIESTEAGRYAPPGDMWRPDWPVVWVDFDAATAYAAWYAEKTGRPWRLPDEREWEKAARGVDGRFFPWGDGWDPAFCHTRSLQHTREIPERVDSFPIDTSIYGVRGMAGNVREWCRDVFDPSWVTGPPEEQRGTSSQRRRLRVVKGGSWLQDQHRARAASREGVYIEAVDLGFRLVRSV